MPRVQPNGGLSNEDEYWMGDDGDVKRIRPHQKKVLAAMLRLGPGATLREISKVSGVPERTVWNSKRDPDLHEWMRRYCAQKGLTIDTAIQVWMEAMNATMKVGEEERPDHRARLAANQQFLETAGYAGTASRHQGGAGGNEGVAFVTIEKIKNRGDDEQTILLRMINRKNKVLTGSTDEEDEQEIEEGELVPVEEED